MKSKKTAFKCKGIKRMKTLQFYCMSYIITLLFSLGLITDLSYADTAAMPVSVHDMFKDIPQDELLQMMEEGQQFIKYLEEHGTPEEKMAFAQAMEETLQSFSEDDWKEFEQIVETVQDKLPPMLFEPQAPIKVEPVKETPQPTKVTKPTAVDNSLDKVLQDIHKAINSLLLKAKSDKILAERITLGWENKNEFNEMARLLQVLRNKDHIAKLTSSKDEAIKSLHESILNFNKRLQLENDKFIIADTFGLQADEETTAVNLKKLNKILEFLDTAIASLQPKLIKFLEEYEPEALKIAAEHDQDAKKALDHATKIERQRRPLQGQQRPHQQQKTSSKNYAQAGSNKGATGTGHSTTQQVPHYLDNVHMGNINNLPHMKASKKDAGTEKKPEAKKDEKKSIYAQAVDKIEDYFDENSQDDIQKYHVAVNKVPSVYKSFGTPISQEEHTRAESLIQRSADGSHQLHADEAIFLEKHQERVKTAQNNFKKNTDEAYSYYAQLKSSINEVTPQIDSLISVIQHISANLKDMNLQELEQLQTLKTLKKLEQQLNAYEDTMRRAQNAVYNQHKLHKMEQVDPSVRHDYNQLADKVASIHGLDDKIAQARSNLHALHKSIKSSIARKKRNAFKQMSA